MIYLLVGGLTPTVLNSETLDQHQTQVSVIVIQPVAHLKQPEVKPPRAGQCCQYVNKVVAPRVPPCQWGEESPVLRASTG